MNGPMNQVDYHAQGFLTDLLNPYSSITEYELVLNSISEIRPTSREIREHRETLLRLQSYLYG